MKSLDALQHERHTQVKCLRLETGYSLEFHCPPIESLTYDFARNEYCASDLALPDDEDDELPDAVGPESLRWLEPLASEGVGRAVCSTTLGGGGLREIAGRSGLRRRV